MRLYDFIIEQKDIYDFDNQSISLEVTVDASGYVDSLEYLSEAIEELNETVIYYNAMQDWDRRHRLPKRLRRRPRDNRRACCKGRRAKLERRFDQVGFCSRSWIYDGNDAVVIRPNRRWEPPIPDDYEQARVESVMEQYGWPMEEVYHSHLAEQLELSDKYYDEYMNDLQLDYLDDLRIGLLEEHERSEVESERICDEEYEAMRRDPNTGRTYEDWYD